MSKIDSRSYDPAAVEKRLFEYWEDTGHFKAQPSRHAEPFCMVIPPPNVTGALHLGHALNNTLQDILIRHKRMQGYNTFWLVGTDHAGIATQATVEKTIRKTEGKSRHDLGREELVKRIWDWKAKYGSRIVEQLKLMGCSCDYSRERFTLDDGCAKAVRETFFKLFRDGLIYRGKRLVNWDTELQTAVADDEVYHETVKGHFYHLKYPIVAPASPPVSGEHGPQARAHETQTSRTGEPDFVHVATTRPETMLGDTAVAVHPQPDVALNKAEAELRDKLKTASDKDKPEITAQIDAIIERRATHLPTLLALRDMAKAGRKVLHPLTNREIPLILDDWARPELGSGCVKITPAHDANDYDVYQRHPEIGMINVLTADGKIAEVIELDGAVNPCSKSYKGLKFATAGRQKVVDDLEAGGFLEKVEDRQIDLGHSDRSKSPIEPFLSDQWFVKMGDLTGDEAANVQTPFLREYLSGYLNSAASGSAASIPGLAQMAIDAVKRGDVTFHPPRYEKTYTDWLSEKRDWCISRQLWWGHRIPVWTFLLQTREGFQWGGIPNFQRLNTLETRHCVNLTLKNLMEGNAQANRIERREDAPPQLCFLDEPSDTDQRLLIDCSFVQDPDVLDTWFSSALWPHSTLGWPDAELPRGGADLARGEPPLPHGRGSDSLAHARTTETQASSPNPQASPGTKPPASENLLATFYPTSVLSTAREIITLWVARMVMFGLYNLGKAPFKDVVIHPVIQDGQGRKMSKSLGNGVDPVDIIDKYGADALRFTLAELATETQDIRMPVTAEKQADGREINISPRFEKGRNFCNKLWQAATGYVLPNLEGHAPKTLSRERLRLEDRWILSRMTSSLKRVDEALAKYRFSETVAELYRFMWDDYCSAYLEMTKPRMNADDGDVARQVLAFVLDRLLRMLHPVTPYVTEAVWEEFRRVAPQRGLFNLEKADDALISADWPVVDETLLDAAVEREMEHIQSVIRTGREIRTLVNEYRGQTKSPTLRTLPRMVVAADADACRSFKAHADFIRALAGCDVIDIGEGAAKPAGSFSRVIGPVAVHVPVADLIDLSLVRANEEKKLVELRQAHERAAKQLSNESFVQRADPGIVEQARRRAAELEAQIEAAERHIAELA